MRQLQRPFASTSVTGASPLLRAGPPADTATVLSASRFPPLSALPLTRPPLWVPIILPCWSGGMPVLVEDAAEPVPSADIEVRDPLRIGNRSG